MNDPYGQQAVATGVTDGPALRKAAELRAMKPVVYFIGIPHFWIWHNGKDEVASLERVLNHPRLGLCHDVRTSTVLRKFDGGFETRNTIYKKATVEIMGMFQPTFESNND